jgi:hypothetical protein
MVNNSGPSKTLHNHATKTFLFPPRLAKGRWLPPTRCINGLLGSFATREPTLLQIKPPGTNPRIIKHPPITPVTVILVKAFPGSLIHVITLDTILITQKPTVQKPNLKFRRSIKTVPRNDKENKSPIVGSDLEMRTNSRANLVRETTE